LAEAGLSERLICYSVKANSNLAVIATLAQLGAGADIVSQGELRRALEAGVPAEKIVFSGVGKTAEEMRAALAVGILQFNVESLSEIDLLADTATAMGKTAHIALRVNPDIDAGTHEKISTGKAENKFGIAWEEARTAFAHAEALDGVTASGIDIHIGSQITELEPFRRAFEKIAGLLADLRADGHDIRRLDLGGGLGVPYGRDNDTPPDPSAYAQIIADTLGDSGCMIMLEPGRLIAANAGILVTSVIRTKQGQAKNFMIVDAAMTELMRPTLYGAHHHIAPIDEDTGAHDAAIKQWDVVGPVCETGDYLGLDRDLPVLESGALLAIFAAGAYGAVLGSAYNTRLPAPEVLVDGEKWAIVRARPDYQSLLAGEAIPDWL
jgi:diaminopimelate decarboxylase